LKLFVRLVKLKLFVGMAGLKPFGGMGMVLSSDWWIVSVMPCRSRPHLLRVVQGCELGIGVVAPIVWSMISAEGDVMV
jgi:hypothetical protein